MSTDKRGDIMQEAIVQGARSCNQCKTAGDLEIQEYPGKFGVHWYLVYCNQCGGWKTGVKTSPDLAVQSWNEKNDKEEKL